MRPTAFDDRTLRMGAAPDPFAGLCEILASPTRLAILRELARSAPDPLNMNELARRVGVDASPVRGHLQIMLKEGLVAEVEGPARERRFTTRLLDATLTLEGVNRTGAAPRGPVPKAVAKLERKLSDLDRDAAKLASKAAQVRIEIGKAWAEAEKGKKGA